MRAQPRGPCVLQIRSYNMFIARYLQPVTTSRSAALLEFLEIVEPVQHDLFTRLLNLAG